jgi:mgtE-like transporter
MTGVRDILRESLPLLLAMAALEVIAGSFLGRMEHSLERLPGLLAMVPAVLAMRGNIYASMASRLSTATRFGSVPPDRWTSPVVWHNVAASMALGVIVAFGAAVLAHLTTRSIGLPSAGILPLAAIAIISAVLSGVVMSGITVAVMRISFRRGLDMDNIAGPIIMTSGDVVTLVALWLSALWIGGGP